jgi:hypothetical protein
MSSCGGIRENDKCHECRVYIYYWQDVSRCFRCLRLHWIEVVTLSCESWSFVTVSDMWAMTG